MRLRTRTTRLEAGAWRDATAGREDLPPGAMPDFVEAVLGALPGAGAGPVLVEHRRGTLAVPLVVQGGIAQAMPFGMPCGPVVLEGDPLPLPADAVTDAAGAQQLLAFVHHTRAADYEGEEIRDTHTTHVIPRERLAEGEAAYKQRGRRKVKAARKAGVEIERGGPGDAAALVELLRTAAAEGDRPFYPEAEVIGAVASSEQALILFALHEGERVSAMLFLDSPIELFYWLGGTLGAHNERSPSYALLDAAVGIAAERERAFLNLGSSDTLPGVAQFKEGFGAESVSYPSLAAESR